MKFLLILAVTGTLERASPGSARTPADRAGPTAAGRAPRADDDVQAHRLELALRRSGRLLGRHSLEVLR